MATITRAENHQQTLLNMSVKMILFNVMRGRHYSREATIILITYQSILGDSLMMIASLRKQKN